MLHPAHAMGAAVPLLVGGLLVGQMLGWVPVGSGANSPVALPLAVLSFGLGGYQLVVASRGSTALLADDEEIVYTEPGVASLWWTRHRVSVDDIAGWSVAPDSEGPGETILLEPTDGGSAHRVPMTHIPSRARDDFRRFLDNQVDSRDAAEGSPTE